MSMLRDFEAIRIKLASPEEMMSWSHGEVTNAETINYRTFRAEVDGLMDERIFGPTKDYECFCGKYKKIRYKGIICDRCGVEVTTKRVRRERLGHIKLSTPVTHVWYAHGVPNKLAMILNVPQKKLETVIYYARYLITDVDEQGKEEALEKIKDIKQEEIAALDEDLKDRLDNLKKDFDEQKARLKKEVKDKKKHGVQLERLEASERKETALVKSAYNQKVKNLDEKFDELKSLIGNIEVSFTISEEENLTLEQYELLFFSAGMGAEAVRTLLQNIDLEVEVEKLEEELATTKSEAKKNRATQRKKLFKGILQAEVKPEWIVLDIVPVLPPDLRPIIQLPGGRFATSDLNDLYRRTINRNNRLKRLIQLGAPEVILRNEKRMLQEAVDALLDNSHRPGSPTLNSRGMPYKSLSDQLRGKQGRFRQNLLGKRVDYSGRAVITPGPELSYDECGLPKNVALELFKPFIIRELIARGHATNPARARLLFNEKHPAIWDILEEVSYNRPVLLNRAPTLHKQSIVAFYPKLIEGNAIRLHPMMCKGYNADFDGDQMAVHLPLSAQAVRETEDRMFAPSNMLSMANGEPIMEASKDMAMGAYSLTFMDGKPEDAKRAFASEEEALSNYHLQQVTLYEPVRLLRNGELLTTTVGRIIYNQVLPEEYPFVNETQSKKGIAKIAADIFDKHGRTAAIKALDGIKTLGFKYGGVSGFSVSMGEFDFNADDEVNERLADFQKKEDELIADYYDGLISQEELSRLIREEWMETYEGDGGIWDRVWELAVQSPNNLTHLNASGAVPVASWIKNITGVRGAVTDVDGKLVDLPLMGNYRHGLNNFEYFVAARQTRKSFADVALRTADSGYLTRRLVDVAQDVVVREVEPTGEGLYLERSAKRAQSYAQRIRGRYLAEDIIDPATGEVIAKNGELVSVAKAEQIEANKNIERVKVHSPLTSTVIRGVSVMDYGYDFGTGDPVRLGEAVGIVAAQSLGEPTTQLTLKSKSDARAGGDVTQGLPRVEELLEVRTPKAKAIIADIPGKLKIIDNEDGILVRVSSTKKMRKTYTLEDGDRTMVKRAQEVKKGDVLIMRKDDSEVNAEYAGKIELADDKLYLLIDRELESEFNVENRINLMVEDGQEVELGQQLTYGSVDPKELAVYAGIESAQRYILEELQAVYAVYGIPVDDVHIELIVRQMSRFGQITKAGDTDYLPGEYIDIGIVDHLNKELEAAGKEQVAYERVLLGLTNAALRTESFLSAASFEQQVRVLTDASLIGKVDHLRGLKENVIIGRPVPIGDMFMKKMQGEELSVDLSMGLDNPEEEAETAA